MLRLVGPKSRGSTRPAIGWREWVYFPTFGVGPVKAKIDTGARTSALHAFDLHTFEKDGKTWARFAIHPHQRSAADARTVTVELIDRRTVRSSSGTLEVRPVISTEVILAKRRLEIQLTLTRRDEMGFRMLIGRGAIRRRFVVDPGRSYLGGGAG